MPALHIDIKDVVIDWIIQKAQCEYTGNSILDLLFAWKAEIYRHYQHHAEGARLDGKLLSGKRL